MAMTDEPLQNAGEISTFVTDNDEFQQSVFVQFRVLKAIQGLTHPGDTDTQSKLAERYARAFPRFKHEPEALENFTSLLRMENAFDILESLAPRRRIESIARSEPNEQVYRSVGGFIGRYVEATHFRPEPLGFHFWSGVALLATAVGRQSVLHAGSAIQLNQYVVLMGDPFTGTQAVVNLAIDIFERTNRILSEGIHTDSLRITHLNSVADQYPTLVNLCQTQRLVMQAGGSAAMIPGEAVALVTCMDFGELLSTSRAAEMLWKAATSDHYQSPTSAACIERMALSVLSVGNVNRMRKATNSVYHRGQLLDHCHLVYRETTTRSRPLHESLCVDPIKKESLAVELAGVAAQPHGKDAYAQQVMALDPEARQFMRRLYRDSRSNERRIAKSLRREDEAHSRDLKERHVLKLAALLAVSDCVGSPMAVDESHVSRALALVEAENPHFKAFRRRAAVDVEAARSEAALQFFRKYCADGSTKTRWELNEKYPFENWTGGERNKILDTLVSARQLRVERYGKRFWGTEGKQYGLPLKELRNAEVDSGNADTDAADTGSGCSQS